MQDQWREPGCSMCLGMNPDQVPEEEGMGCHLQVIETLKDDKAKVQEHI